MASNSGCSPPLGLALRKKPKKRASAATASTADYDKNVAAASSAGSSRRRPVERDESEFVSVAVGMRELQRRLASAGSSVTLPETQPKKRARSAATAAVVVKQPKPKPAPKPKPKKKAARKPTIAEIRAELLREQQLRVETRIQTLQCANCKSATHVNAHHVNSASLETEGETTIVYEQEGGAHRQQQQAVVMSSMSTPAVTLDHEQEHHLAAADGALDTTRLVAASAPLSLIPTLAASSSQALPASASADTSSEVTVKNEFIDDDLDEDMAFMMALDQVERSLTTPTKQQPPSHLLRAPEFQAANQQQKLDTRTESAASQPCIKSEPQDLSQVRTTICTLSLSHSSVATSQCSRSIILPQRRQPAPVMSEMEMLREYERLKRENELLRQSNVLLQTAAGSSSSSSAAVSLVSSSPLAQHLPSPPTYHASTQPPASVLGIAAILAQVQHGEAPEASRTDTSNAQQPQQPADAHSDAQQSHHHAPAHHALGIGSDRVSSQTQQGGEMSVLAAREAADHRSLNLGTMHTAGEAKTNTFCRDTHDDNASMIEHPPSELATVKMEPHEHMYHPQRSELVERRTIDFSCDGDNAAPPDDSQAAVDQEHAQVSSITRGSLREHGEGAALCAEDNDESTRSQPSDEIEPSQDEVANQKDDDNEEDEDEEENEVSQQEPVRESTIDRGNYDQYKTAQDDADDDEDDDDEEEETKDAESGGDVDMVDAEQDATSGTAVSEAWSAGVENHRDPKHLVQDRAHSRVREPSDKIDADASALASGADDVTTPTSSRSDHGADASSGSHMLHHAAASRSSHTADEDHPMQVEELPASTVRHHIDDDDAAAVKVEVYNEPAELSASSISQPNAKTLREHVRAISSSDSETESDDDNGGEDESSSEDSDDDDDEAGDDGAPNGLEAALKAAAAGSGTNVNKSTSLKKDNSARQSRGAFSLEATSDDRVKFSEGSSKQAKKKRSRTSDADSDSEATGLGKRVARPRPQLGSGASSSIIGGNSSSTDSSSISSVRSSLLWPTLDDFYDFVLDLSPRKLEISQRHQANLRRYSRGTLPATYPNLNEYTSVQIEAIMEELVASLRSSEQTSGQHSSKSLQLTSVSPCGRGRSGQQLSFFNGQQLNSSAIFMESGFSGSTTNKNDYILTFQPQHLGKKGSSSSSSGDFINGDLVLLRSPRWKDYEMIVYGVVLCNSVVAVGGGSDSRGGAGGNRGGGRNDDLICVLIRTQERDHTNPKESFSVLTEMCLANQRSPNWKWRLGYVHNLTTSAREFQAMKSVSFFSPATKRSLLEGTLNATNTQRATREQQEEEEKETGTSGKSASTVAAAGAIGIISAKTKSRLAPALFKELEKKYNSSQLDAILSCIGEENHVTIIQGPVRRRLESVAKVCHVVLTHCGGGVCLCVARHRQDENHPWRAGCAPRWSCRWRWSDKSEGVDAHPRRCFAD